jgi:hypothetical protein
VPLLRDKASDVRAAAAQSLSSTPTGLALLCAQEFPTSPQALTASQRITPPEAGAFEEKSWHFDNFTRTSIALLPGEAYRRVSASDKDREKVSHWYQMAPVPGYEVTKVEVIYNPVLNTKFKCQLDTLQHREGVEKFKPKWDLESEPTWRAEVNTRVKNLSAPYKDSDYKAVSLLPLWHGTHQGALDTVFKTGFANLAETDSGYFGKGLYGTPEAEYAYRVYAKKHKENAALLINWVAFYSAYPVIEGDMEKLEGKSNYSNYDAHFIPVKPKTPTSKISYIPCKSFEAHTYCEVVTFDPSSYLPRYIVELSPTAALLKDLETALHDSQLAGCETAIETVGELGRHITPVLLTRLEELMGDKEVRVRKAVVIAVGELGVYATPKLLVDLEGAMKDSKWEVRKATATAVGQLGARATLALLKGLEGLIKDIDYGVREATATAIGKLGLQATPALLKGLEGLIGDSDWGVREATAIAIGKLGAQATPALKAGLQVLTTDKEPNVSKAALTAISQLKSAAEILGQTSPVSAPAVSAASNNTPAPVPGTHNSALVKHWGN